MKTCLRVGIADDDPDLRLLLTQSVRHLGHEVVCAAENGEQLLERSATLEMDIALVDFDMPLCDGLAVADELSRSRGVPVIIISGHPDLQHMIRKKEPVAAFLRKPFTMEALQAAIDSCSDVRSS